MKKKIKINHWRRVAHFYFDQLWLTGKMSRADAYRWLSQRMNKKLKDTHISNFSVKECQKVIRISQREGGA